MRQDSELISSTALPASVVTAAIVASARANRCLAGCQLKRLLERIGIDAGLGCGCTSRAALMDAGLIETDALVEQMRTEAQSRGLKFSESQVRWLIELAQQLAQEGRNPTRLERTRLRAIQIANRVVNAGAVVLCSLMFG